MEIEKHTIETFAKKEGLTRQSAINKLSKLRRQSKVFTTKGSNQKRIYTILSIPQKPTNGFYDLVNKYSPEKLVPKFKHHVVGRYSVEKAIIDGIKIGDLRTLNATMHLFRHVNSWKRLFDYAKKEGLEDEVRNLYLKARKVTKTKKIPKRYEK